MVHYAIKECAGCHQLRPANEMRQHSRRVTTGGSESTYCDRQGSRGGSRSTTSYRNETYFLCPPCHEARRKAQLILAVLGLLAVAVLFVVGSLSQDGPARQEPTTQPSEPTDLLDGIDLNQVNTVSPDPIETSPSPPEQLAGDELAQPPPDRSDDRLSEPTAPSIDPIESDVQDALRSGEATLWRNGGETGYVVPSDLQAGVNEQCRTFTVTIIEGQSQRQIDHGERCYDEAAQRWLPR